MEVASLAASALQSFAHSQVPATPAVAAAKPEASAEAMAQLDQALKGPAAGDAAQKAQPASGVGAQGEGTEPTMTPVSEAASSGQSPGDAILRNLNRMSQGFGDAVGKVNASLDRMKAGGAVNPAELLSLQMQLQQVTFHQDLTGKVAGKATNSLDTFLKNQ